MKITKTFLFLSTILLVVLFAFNACNTTNDQNAEIATSTAIVNKEPTKLLVSQPFKNVNQSPKVLSHQNPSKPKSYTLETGTVINVPADAFEYLDGQPVEGAVELQFTEIHSAAEIIASGIPMKFIDENGEEQQMQSAGMFEIQGVQNNQPVRIAEGKTIDIALLSDVEGDYDFWSFDEDKGNWLNEGAREATDGPVQNVTPTAVQNQIRQLENQTKKKPVKPEFSDANKLVFNDLDLSSAPELKNQKPVVLIYVGKDKSKAPQENKWIRNPGIWHKKTIKPVAGEEGIYELTLLGDKMYQIKVKSAPTALEIDKANADYQKELADYRTSVNLLKDQKSLIERRKTFMRLASLRGFGKYNYDVMWKKPDAISLKADFEMEGVPEMFKDKSIVYLITDNGRTVVSLPKTDWNKFRFSPSSDNKLLAVLPDNTAAIFKESDFEKQKEEMIESAGNAFVFSMESKEEEIESLADLDKLLSDASTEKIDPIQTVKVYPNPARSQVMISFESEASFEAPIQIFNASGQQVANRSMMTQRGENTEQFDISNLPNGNYMVRISTDDFVETKQLVIAKN